MPQNHKDDPIFGPAVYYSTEVQPRPVFRSILSLAKGLALSIQVSELELKTNKQPTPAALLFTEARNIAQLGQTLNAYEVFEPLSIAELVTHAGQKRVALRCPKVHWSKYYRDYLRRILKSETIAEASEIAANPHIFSWDRGWLKKYLSDNVSILITSDPASPASRLLMLIGQEAGVESTGVVVSRLWRDPVEWRSNSIPTKVFVHPWFWGSQCEDLGWSLLAVGPLDKHEEPCEGGSIPVVFFTQYYARACFQSYFRYWTFNWLVAKWATKRGGVVHLHPSHSKFELLVHWTWSITGIRYTTESFEIVCARASRVVSHSSGANTVFTHMHGRRAKHLDRCLYTKLF